MVTIDFKVVAAVISAIVAIFTLAGLLVAFGRWLWRLEGRQAIHEAVCSERQLHIAAALARIEATQKSEHVENKGTLRRLEDLLAEKKSEKAES